MFERVRRLARVSALSTALGWSLLLLLINHIPQAHASEGTWESVSGATVVQGDRVYARGVGFYTDNTVDLGGASPTGSLRIVVTSSSLPVTNQDDTDDSGNPVFLLGSASDTTRILFAMRRAPFGYTTELQEFIEDTGPVDSDDDGVPDVDDNCPNDANPGQEDLDGDGIGDACDPVDDTDTDNDGIRDELDNCPVDANPGQEDLDGDGIGDACDPIDDTDTDNDGIRDELDNCPNDANPGQEDLDGDGIGDACDPIDDTDTDNDGIRDELDNCPVDANPGQEDLDGDGIGDACDPVDDTDTDNDGVRDEIDNCPVDANPNQEDIDEDGIGDACDPVDDRDSDNDGIADTDDLCPDDDTNTCISITGEVFAAGATIFNADVKIGLNTVETTTDEAGGFTAGVGNGESSANATGIFFPIEVNAPGFSTANVKVNYFPGVTEYEIEVSLVEVSTTLVEDDDLNEGVDIIGDGEPVGSLTIPDASLPSGVSDVTGDVTYLDPATNDINAGPDLLALPEDADPNDTPVTLETFGMMKFDLVDQNGDPISELDGPAQVCMQATPGLTEGETVPLWYYDEEAGLWIEEGQGTVVDVDGQLQICGDVMHFTWWNYDRPIETHSCFKFQMKDADTGLPLTGISWYAEGVTYSGTSPNRFCNDTPEGFDSLTVKRSEGGVTEQIRVYGQINGIKYYLHREGPDDYTLKSAVAGAEVFDTPTDQGSCLSGTRSGFCENLDYADDNDAMLSISSDINLPPVISQFTLSDNALNIGATADAMATVTDPEGTDVSVEWQAQCFIDGGGSVSPTMEGPSTSGTTFSALFTAPASLSSLFEYCNLTLTATDADGNSATAQRFLTVVGNTQFRFTGQVFGTDGLPEAFADVSYFNFCGESIQEFTSADVNGFYEILADLSSCGFGEEFFFGQLGQINVSYQNNVGEFWQRFTNLDDSVFGFYGGEFGFNCFTDPEGITECSADIYLPTLWTDLTCTYHKDDAFNDELVDFNHFGVYGDFFTQDSFFSGTVSGPAGSYDICPSQVPLGEMGADVFTRISANSFSFTGATYFNVPSLEPLIQDVGDLGNAVVPTTVTVFDNAGDPLPGALVDAEDVINDNFFLGNVPTDVNGEVSFLSSLGAVSAVADVQNVSDDFSYYGGGIARRMDIPLLIDLNSPDQCQVQGTAFDSFDQPLALQTFTVEIFTGGPNDVFTDVTTDINGDFVFDAVPGELYIYGGMEAGFFGADFIDNCRGASPRIIRRDVRFGFPDEFFEGGPF